MLYINHYSIVLIRLEILITQWVTFCDLLKTLNNLFCLNSNLIRTIYECFHYGRLIFIRDEYDLIVNERSHKAKFFLAHSFINRLKNLLKKMQIFLQIKYDLKCYKGHFHPVEVAYSFSTFRFSHFIKTLTYILIDTFHFLINSNFIWYGIVA